MRSELVEPQFHEMPELRPNHGVKNLGEVVLKSVVRGMLEGLVVAEEPQRLALVAYAYHELTPLGVQERGHRFHDRTLKFAVHVAALVVEAERRLEFQPLVLVGLQELGHIRLGEAPALWIDAPLQDSHYRRRLRNGGEGEECAGGSALDAD